MPTYHCVQSGIHTLTPDNGGYTYTYRLHKEDPDPQVIPMSPAVVAVMITWMMLRSQWPDPPCDPAAPPKLPVSGSAEVVAFPGVRVVSLVGRVL